MTEITDNNVFPDARRERRTILLASLGGALEYYDFILYGVFAGPITAAFFPNDDPLVGLIKTFLVFAVGYFARPFGGAVLGRLGDRYGRRGVFLASVLVVSASTFAMALLPGYAVLGVAAPVLMVLLRAVQGFCLGGELPGAATYAVETARRWPGLACGVVFCLVNSGVLAAALLNLGLNAALTPAEVDAWGWRLAFAIGGALGLAAFFVRRALEESRGFRDLEEPPARTPLKDIFSLYRAELLVGIGLMAASAAYNGLLFAHTPAYFAKALAYPREAVALAQNLCLGIGSAALLGFAFLGDLYPRRRILRLGAGLLVLVSWPFYRAMADHSLDLLTAFAVWGVLGALANGVFAALVADLFPTRLRFTGLALVMNASFTLFGGLAPLIATWLTRSTGDAAAPGLFLAGAAALSFAASLFCRRYEGRIVGGA
jgi:MFS family permease